MTGLTFKRPLNSQVEAWCWIIYHAPLTTTQRDLAHRWGWTAPKVQRLLDKWKSEGWIDAKGSRAGTVISLGISAPLPNHALGHRPKIDAKIDVPNDAKSEQPDEPFSPLSEGDLFSAPAPGKGKRLPADWFLPRAWGDWAVEQGLARDEVKREAATFRDYWIAQPGQKGVKRDWLATWRNWIRRKVDDRKPASAPGGGSSLMDQILSRGQ